MTVAVFPDAEIVKIPGGVTDHAAPEAAFVNDVSIMLSPGRTLIGPVNDGLAFTVKSIVASF